MALVALAAVIAPIPHRADAYTALINSTSCTSSATQSAGGGYYICYDISAKSVAVYRSVNGVATSQFGPVISSANRLISPGAPNTGAAFGSNECTGYYSPLFGYEVIMTPGPTTNGWTSNGVLLEEYKGATTYPWDQAIFSVNTMFNLVSYANSSIPSYRCVVVP